MQAIESASGNRSVVHHVLVNYKAKPDLQRTPVLKLSEQSGCPAAARPAPAGPGRPAPSRLLAMPMPPARISGVPAGNRAPARSGRRDRKLQIHYTANGTATTDRTGSD